MTRPATELRIGVIGLGPVGSVLAAHLADAGATVVVCDIMESRLQDVLERGIHLKNSIERVVPIKYAVNSISDLASHDLDLICIAVKTTAMDPVLSALEPLLNDKLHLISVQNGIGNEVTISRRFGAEKILRMVVNYAGGLDGEDVDVSFFNPPNYIGNMMIHGQQMAEDIASLLNGVGLTTEVTSDIEDHVWEKAILNASMSCVCAITGKTMKEVMDFPPTQELVEALITESVRVAEAEGIELGKKFRRFAMRYLKNAGHHKPSMLVDMENNRLTEVDYLNGMIEEIGRKHFIPTPLNRSISSMIHIMEQ